MLKTKCLVLGKWPASRRLTSNTSKMPPAVQRAATTSPSNPPPPHHPPPSSTAVQRAATTSHQPPPPIPTPLNSSQGFWPHFSIELQILCLDQPLQWEDINKGEFQFCVKTFLVFSNLCMQALLFPSITYASQLQFIFVLIFFFYFAGWWLWGWEECLLPYQIDVQDIQRGFAGTFRIMIMHNVWLKLR